MTIRERCRGAWDRIRQGRTGLQTGLAWLLMVLLAQLVPPAQSPDEMAHLGRAYLISSGEWLLQTPTGQDSGGWIDPSLGVYLQRFEPVIKDATSRLLPEEWRALEQIEWSGTPSAYAAVAGTGYYLPVLYAPHGLGLAMGRAMGWGVHHSYWLARGMVMACVALMVSMAWRLWCPNPLVVVLLLLPMSLFQAVSPTLDGLSAALLMLSMALFFNQWHRNSDSLGWNDAMLGICLVVLCSTRTHLLPMLALPWLLAWRRRLWVLTGVAAMTLLLTTAWVLWAMRTVVDTRVARALSPHETLLQYIKHPTELAVVVVNTLASTEQLSFYGRSFLGILGWLDTPLPHGAYGVLTVGLGLAAGVSISCRSLQTDWPLRLVLWGIGLLSVVMVFVAMLLTWTPFPATVIHGVQGRYFLLPAMLMAYGLSGTESGCGWGRWRTVVAGLVGSTCVGVLIYTLLLRYH